MESSAAAEARALIERGSGLNVAATATGARDPRLRPRPLPHRPEVAADAVARAIETIPRWRLTGRTGLVVSATRTTRLFRFVDDVIVLVEPADAGSVLRARSASRIGRRDFGQNRRNLAELWRALPGG